MTQEIITIRQAQLQDAAAIATIARLLGWFEQVNRMSVEEAEQHVAQQLTYCLSDDSHTILVAERVMGGEVRKVVGYLAAHWYSNLVRGGDGYISELFIHPDETGKGVGGQLLRTIEAYARQRQCTRLLLMNRRDRESYRRGFYRKHGWQEVSEGAYFVRSLSA
jgi:GNAT superfamily N-acetyltransferase